MPTALITHPACLLHDNGPYHPECPDRLRAIMRVLEARSSPHCCGNRPRVRPSSSSRACIRANTSTASSRSGPIPARWCNSTATRRCAPDSAEAALRAAGGAVAAVDAVMEGWARAAFAAVRPPGHHAEPSRPMGFCLFANAAIAAEHARTRWGLGRVAVVDFDVHHGNGTQAIFASRPGLFYASSHQYPCYPGTGHKWEHGVANNIVNAPLPPGSGSAAFRSAWSDTIFPALDEFAPELLIISAGFDAHKADPLAQLRLETGDFAWITRELVAMAGRHCGDRIASVLEGGYELSALAASVAAHVRALMRV